MNILYVILYSCLYIHQNFFLMNMVANWASLCDLIPLSVSRQGTNQVNCVY